MGRHSAPAPEGAGPHGGRTFAVLAGTAIVAAAAIVIVSVTVRGGDGVDQTRPEAEGATVISPTLTTAPPSGALASTSTTAVPSPSITPSPTVSGPPPPTLVLALTGPSYVTVRGPEGHTLDTGLFGRGDRLLYNQPLLRVVIGNAAAVRVTVNGKDRKPGRPGQVQRFTVRRR